MYNTGAAFSSLVEKLLLMLSLSAVTTGTSCLKLKVETTCSYVVTVPASTKNQVRCTHSRHSAVVAFYAKEEEAPMGVPHTPFGTSAALTAATADHLDLLSSANFTLLLRPPQGRTSFFLSACPFHQ